MTGIEPALSAWELACHALLTMVLQVSCHFDLSASVRCIPLLALLSGTQRARPIYRVAPAQTVRCQASLDAKLSNLITVNDSGKHVFMAADGTVYLLHFERPYRGQSRHYLGYTLNLDERIALHRRGTACALTKVAFDRGIGFTVARTWPGTPKLKRQIKELGTVNCCPLCPTATLPRPT